MFGIQMINDPYDYLRISMLPGIGSNRGRTLLREFGDFSSLLNAELHELISINGIHRQLAGTVLEGLAKERTCGEIERLVDKNRSLCLKHSYTYLCYDDTSYPLALKGIYDPPLYLFVWGELCDSDQKAAAIVGTRHPSEYGRQVADMFSSTLARDGITVVSGMALGIDSVAHRSALQSGGRSIAVLGSGLRRLYPHSNRELAHALSEHGCVLSELPLEAAPDAVNFPRRNRIISGLSRCLLVVESAARGGAMITAQIALDQGKDVYAIPGSIFNKKSDGCHDLLRRSMAKAVTCVDDIYSETLALRSNNTRPPVPLQLSLVEESIVHCLGCDPMHIDDIAITTGLSLPSLLVDLLQLEFKGAVRQLPGKHFVRGPGMH